MTKKEAFKKYLHLYVGGKAQVLLKQGDDIDMAYITFRLIGGTCEQTSIQELYLRPLSSMTDREALEFLELRHGKLSDQVNIGDITEKGIIIYSTIQDATLHEWDDVFTPEQFTWLLKKGFCIDDTLFKEGHAKPLA